MVSQLLEQHSSMCWTQFEQSMTHATSQCSACRETKRDERSLDSCAKCCVCTHLQLKSSSWRWIASLEISSWSWHLWQRHGQRPMVFITRRSSIAVWNILCWVKRIPISDLQLWFSFSWEILKLQMLVARNWITFRNWAESKVESLIS